MCSKFEKYWEPDEANPRSKDHNPLRKNKEIAFNLALVIATLLDPRKKKTLFGFLFQEGVQKCRSDWYSCGICLGVDEKVFHIV